MTNIEQKALALVNEVSGRGSLGRISLHTWTAVYKALCRAIEQHEAFRREVSDAAQEYEEAGYCMGWEGFERFIIPAPKPDPLEEVLQEIDHAAMWVDECAKEIRAALEARGLEIREKGK